MVTVVIPLVRLSVVVFFHTILSTWAMFGGEFLGEGYLFQQVRGGKRGRAGRDGRD